MFVSMNTTRNTNTVSITKLTNGENWARFETAKGRSFGTLHNSLGMSIELPVSDLQLAAYRLRKAGWKVC